MRNILRKALPLLFSAAILSCNPSNPSSSNNGNNNGGNQHQNRAPMIECNLAQNVVAEKDEGGNYVVRTREFAVISFCARDLDGDKIFYEFSETGGTKPGSFSPRSGQVDQYLMGTVWYAPTSVPAKEKHTIKVIVRDEAGAEDIGRVDIYVKP